MARNSKVILAKGINLDNTYSNVLNYTENEMLTLLRSNDHLMYNGENYSFIRENENQISVQVPYDVCLQSNYLAFQNTDYSNKWFFCFIKDVKYTSDKTTTITYDIDVFSTWFNSITVKPAFIEREHVNDDTRGLHTVPENLETGEYKMQVGSESNYQVQDLYLFTQDDDKIPVFAVTNLPQSCTSGSGSHIYNGIASGLIYIAVENVAIHLNTIINDIENTPNCEIYAIFMAPAKMVNPAKSWDTGNPSAFHYKIVPDSTSYDDLGSVSFNKEDHLDADYIPKNNRLLCFPYCYLSISNLAGGVVNYKYEDFTGNYCKFDLKACISVGCDIKLIPSYLKSTSPLERNFYQNENYYSIDMYKLPTCGWKNDAYTNWLTQNSVNNTVNGIASAGSIALGTLAFATGNPLVGTAMIGSGINGIKDQMVAKKNAQLTPDSANMGSNAGNLNLSMNKTFTWAKMTIRKEYAQIIDDYFTRFGYQINRVKTPNITGRRYWNFVKIGTGENIGNGNVPNKFKDTLNQIFRAGTTIWHSHDNIGNFNLNNTII